MPPAWLLLAIVLMVVLHIYLPIMRWASWPWNVLGAVPMVAGAALVVIAEQQFRRSGTTVKPFRDSTALVSSGAFRFSRNPMYLGMLIALLGIAVALGTLLPLVMPPAFALWITVAFIVPEEKAMARQFGEAFEQYRSRVRRWV